MSNKPSTTTVDEPSENYEMTETSDESNYDLPVELFAGLVILTMGLLVVVTPLITEMPNDVPWNPVLLNVTSGALYIVVGAYFVRRSGVV